MGATTSGSAVARLVGVKLMGIGGDIPGVLEERHGSGIPLYRLANCGVPGLCAAARADGRLRLCYIGLAAAFDLMRVSFINMADRQILQ